MNSIIEYVATNLVIYFAGFFVGGFAKVDVYFGVTVPRHTEDDGKIKEFKQDYKRIYGISAALVLVIIVIANMYFAELRWLFNSYVFIWFALTIYLYVHFHKKVKQLMVEINEHKSEEKSSKKRIVSASLDNRDNEVKHIYLYFVPAFIVCLLSIVYTIINYGNVPENVPVHYNMLGQVDGYAIKSLFSVYGMLMLETFVIITLYITCLGSTKYSRRRIDPRKPETSRIQIRMANQRLVKYLGIMGFLISVSFTGLHLGIFSHLALSPSVIRISAFAPTIIIILGMVIYFLTTGIYGDKIKVDFEEEEKDVEPGIDADEGWVLGMFYYNPKDSSVFVPKRFGGGFTVNFATWGGKIFIGVVLVIIIVAIYSSLN